MKIKINKLQYGGGFYTATVNPVAAKPSQQAATQQASGQSILSDKMLEKLIEVICRYVDIDPSKLNADTNIRSELGLNSLELVNIAVAIEDEFDVEIPDREVMNIETLADAVAMPKRQMIRHMASKPRLYFMVIFSHNFY